MRDRFAETVTGSFFRSWVGQQIWCAGCGGVLDCRRAVLVGTSILCGSCYDRARTNTVAKRGEEAVAAAEAKLTAAGDLIDGRKLHEAGVL